MTDQFLLRQLHKGTATAATRLYFKYAEKLHLLAAARLSPDLSRRVDADDIVQSVFRTFFRRASRGEFEVPDGGGLWKLLLVIALNKIRKKAVHHRAQRRDVNRTDDSQPLDQVTRSKAVEESVAILHLTVEEVLETIPPDNRLIVETRIDGYEISDIAKQLGRSKRTVERVLREFRACLKAVLEED